MDKEYLQKDIVKLYDKVDVLKNKEYTLKSLAGFQCLFLDYKNSDLPNDLKEYLNNMFIKRYNKSCKICYFSKIKDLYIPRIYPRIPDNLQFTTIADKDGVIIINTLSSIANNLDKNLLHKRLDFLKNDGLISVGGYIHSIYYSTIPFIMMEDQSIYKNNPYIDPLKTIIHSNVLPHEYMKNPYI